MAAKKGRTSKTSRGERRSSKPVTLTAIQLINMGKGVYASTPVAGMQKKKPKS